MEQCTENGSFSPPACIELLRRFEEKEAPRSGRKLRFSGVGKNDVYNISAPLRIGRTTVVAGRVEDRTAWADSHVVFFEEENDVWVPTNGAPILRLEDGFAMRIGDETIFGGVEVYPDPLAIDAHGVGYRTVFYRGCDFPSLHTFAVGPDMMKDIRLVSLPHGLGACTRPQGGLSGRGQIGYAELRCPENINTQNILSAKIIEDQFAPGEWGGANELHLLQDGRIGILGHIAYKDAHDDKHYYAMSFTYDPKRHHATPIEIIATRKNFPVGDAKMPALADVVFPGGLVRHVDGTATLYAGLSDVEAGSVILPDPFSRSGVSRSAPPSQK